MSSGGSDVSLLSALQLDFLEARDESLLNARPKKWIPVSAEDRLLNYRQRVSRVIAGCLILAYLLH